MPAGVLLYAADNDYLLANEMTLEELSGQKRIIRLRGSGMPFVGAKWGVHQNAPITWFPGNSEGSQQVLGGQLLPSDWDGRWTRTLLSRSPCYVDLGEQGRSGIKLMHPEKLVQVFESLALSGVRLRVKWRNYTREGRMDEFTHSHGKTTDVEWTAKFSWINRGHKVDQRVQGVRAGSVTGEMDGAALEADTAAALEITYLTVSTRPERLPKSTPTLTIGQIGALLNAPKTMLNGFCRQCRAFSKKMQDVGSLINQVRNLPADLANMVLNETENMIAISNNVIDKLSRNSPEQNAVRTNVAAVVRNASYYGSGQRQAAAVASKCADVRSSLRTASAEASGAGQSDNRNAAQTADVLKIHAVHQGETLSSISFQHYDSPDHAYEIALCNHIPYPCAPDAGGLSIGGKRTLIIPVLKGQGS